MAAQFKFHKSYTIQDFKSMKNASSLAVKDLPNGVSFFAWSPNQGDTGLVSKTLDTSKEIVISAVSWEANGEYPAGEGFLMHNAGGSATTRFTL